MRNQRSPLSLQDRYDNLQIYCQEMREHVQDLEYELSQVCCCSIRLAENRSA